MTESEEFIPKVDPDAEVTPEQAKELYDAMVKERARVVAGMDSRIQDAIHDTEVLADDIDIARRHMEQAALMRFADKENKLLAEIDRALEKMKTGEYGVCEGTGEPIAYRRLQARPWTRYGVAYKEQLEREKRDYRHG